MPVSSETLAAYIPRQKAAFLNGNTIAPKPTIRSMTTEQFAPFNVEPPSHVKSNKPQEINASLNDIEEIETKKPRRLGFWLLLAGALFLLLCAIAAAIAVPILLLRSTATTSTTIGLVSTVTTTTTTIVNCVSPYARTPSGRCVNVLIDINNCGTVGNNCSSNYTSCAAGVCSTAPAIQLANANFLWTAGVNGSIDDNFYGLSLPFNITLYSTTTAYVGVTTNGVLCLGGCSSVYTETALPTTSFPGATAFAFWDDLYIYAGTSQGIYYGTEGSAPNRTLIFECFMSHFSQPSQYYHFQIIFFESLPGIVQYKYYDASDGGITCTVGVQASGSGPFIQYSFDLANSVRQNMSLIFDTNLGIYRNTTF